MKVIYSHKIVLPLMMALPLLLSGCFRQASEPFEDTTSAETISTQVEESGITPTTPSLQVFTSTPIVAQEDGEAQSGGSNTDITPSSTIPILGPTNTRAVITPGPPPGPVDISTPTPLVPNDGIATPSGLVTPTGLFVGEGGSACVYVIQPGDTLYRIALDNNTTVDEIRAANPDFASDLIQPGDQLTLPGCGAVPTAIPQQITNPTPEATDGIISVGRTHTVQAGDTLYGIAQTYGVTVQAIINANSLTNPNQLSIGDELVIP